MEGMTPRPNNLPLFFLQLGDALTSGAGEQMAWCSCRSSNPMRFVSSGRCLALFWVALALTVVVVFDVLQWDTWMAAGGDVPFLQSCWMKLMAPGSNGHGEEPRPTCHKASVSSLAAVPFISLKNILVCKDAPPDLGMTAIPLFLHRCLGSGGGR